MALDNVPECHSVDIPRARKSSILAQRAAIAGIAIGCCVGCICPAIFVTFAVLTASEGLHAFKPARLVRWTTGWLNDKGCSIKNRVFGGANKVRAIGCCGAWVGLGWVGLGWVMPSSPAAATAVEELQAIEAKEVVPSSAVPSSATPSSAPATADFFQMVRQIEADPEYQIIEADRSDVELSTDAILKLQIAELQQELRAVKQDLADLSRAFLEQVPRAERR